MALLDPDFKYDYNLVLKTRCEVYKNHVWDSAGEWI